MLTPRYRWESGMTQRTLVLLRHAKAETGAPDIDRRLSSRGRADAAAAGAWLGAQGHRPGLVICSPARRTRQTWHAVAVALSETAGDPPAPTVQYEAAVYTGTAAELLDLVRAAPEEISSVLLVGHNPTISQLSALLDPEAAMDSDGLRTCGIAAHQVTGAWSECGTRRAPRTASHTARG
jgi:phosphohistidine phosphatase